MMDDIPYHSGFLYKKSKTHGRKWLKRHFRWNGECLTYHHSPQANSPCRLRIAKTEITRIVLGTQMNARPDGNVANYVFHVWLTGSERNDGDYVIPEMQFAPGATPTEQRDTKISMHDTYSERILELAATSEVEREYWVKILGECASHGVYEPVLMNVELGKIGSRTFQIVQPVTDPNAPKEIINYDREGTPIGRSVLKTNGLTALDMKPGAPRTIRMLRSANMRTSTSSDNLAYSPVSVASVDSTSSLDCEILARAQTTKPRVLRTLIPIADAQGIINRSAGECDMQARTMPRPLHDSLNGSSYL